MVNRPRKNPVRETRTQPTPVPPQPDSKTSLSYWIRLIAGVVGVSLGTGFLIGLGEHRDGKQVADFVLSNLKPEFSDVTAMLVFRCGTKDKVVAYDLLTDEILINRDAIEARRHGLLSNFGRSELFGAASGLALSSLGAAYKFSDEVSFAAKSKFPIRRIASMFALAIPSVYLGYSLSDYFKLECSSDKLYDYLYNKENWKPHQFAAMKELYTILEPCIPRRISIDVGAEPSKNSDLNFWLQLISAPLDDLGPMEGPTASEKAAILSKIMLASHVVPAWLGPLPEVKFEDAVWGDSIYTRLFGAYDLSPLDAKIDSADFRILLKQSHACNERAKEYSAKHRIDFNRFIRVQYLMAQHHAFRDPTGKTIGFAQRWLKLADGTEAIR